MKIINNKQLYASGFTIIEVMSAVTVLSIGLIGSLTLINYNLRNISFSEKKIFAAGLAEDGIERIRNARDTNWLQGKNQSNNGANAWDAGISGRSGEEFIKVFCGGGAISGINNPIPSGASEKELIDDCAAAGNCGVYDYSSGLHKCYGDNFGASKNGYAQGGFAGFYRLIHITQINAYSNKISVIARWTEGAQNKYLTVEEVLYNWQ